MARRATTPRNVTPETPAAVLTPTELAMQVIATNVAEATALADASAVESAALIAPLWVLVQAAEAAETEADSAAEAADALPETDANAEALGLAMVACSYAREATQDALEAYYSGVDLAHYYAALVATPAPATLQELVNLATAFVADYPLVDFTSNIVIAEKFIADHKALHPRLTLPAKGNFVEGAQTPVTPKWFNRAALKTTIGRAVIYFVTEQQAKKGGALNRQIRQEPSAVTYVQRPAAPAPATPAAPA